MTFEIRYLKLTTINIFKDALLYLFPKQSNEILNIMCAIERYDIIHIKHNYLTLNKQNAFKSHVHICDDDFVQGVNILKKHNEIFFIYIKNDYEYKYLFNNFGLFNNDIIIENYDFYYVMNNNEIEVIYEDVYKLFFSEYKTVDFNTYIRSRKLKNILT